MPCEANMREGDRELLERYDRLFGASRVAVLDVTAKIIDGATVLRARHGFKTPDAIHLATAIECAATEFWTGDVGLSHCADIAVTVLQPALP
jgi:predicted nucleic acid-binding protein